MEAIKEAIKQIYVSYAGKECEHIEKIPQSGGDRIYFRIKDGVDSYIATYNLNLKENETFIYFAQHFHSRSENLFTRRPWLGIFIRCIRKRRQDGKGISTIPKKFKSIGAIASER
jgi:hypothetical protein